MKHKPGVKSSGGRRGKSSVQPKRCRNPLGHCRESAQWVPSTTPHHLCQGAEVQPPLTPPNDKNVCCLHLETASKLFHVFINTEKQKRWCLRPLFGIRWVPVAKSHNVSTTKRRMSGQQPHKLHSYDLTYVYSSENQWPKHVLTLMPQILNVVDRLSSNTSTVKYVLVSSVLVKSIVTAPVTAHVFYYVNLVLLSCSSFSTRVQSSS